MLISPVSLCTFPFSKQKINEIGADSNLYMERFWSVDHRIIKYLLEHRDTPWTRLLKGTKIPQSTFGSHLKNLCAWGTIQKKLDSKGKPVYCVNPRREPGLINEINAELYDTLKKDRDEYKRKLDFFASVMDLEGKYLNVYMEGVRMLYGWIQELMVRQADADWEKEKSEILESLRNILLSSSSPFGDTS
jgi:hypothetical protein